MSRPPYVKHQLKDDAFSVERRTWYQSMQKDFTDKYENFRTLQALAKEEDEQRIENASINPRLIAEEKRAIHKGDSISGLGLTENLNMKSIISMNSVKRGESDTVAILFPGLGTSHSVFEDFVRNVLTPSEIKAFGICLPGRMHRVRDPARPVMRLTIFELFEEFLATKFFQKLNGKNFIFIGYSYGALIAYELLRLFINANIVNPESMKGFIAVSCRSPLKQSRYNIDRDGQVFYHLEFNDSNLARQMILLEGIPELFQENINLLKKLVPFFRQELQLLETYLIEPPFVPGQVRTLTTVEEEHFQSYYHHFFSSLTNPSSTISLASGSKYPGSKANKTNTTTSDAKPSKLVSYNSAATISTVSTVSSAHLEKPESVKSSTINNSAIHSYSANNGTGTNVLSSNQNLRRSKKDERLLRFQEEINELLEMPISLFKIRLPIFSISTEDDKVFPNEEDIKSWAQHSSLFHQHYVVEGSSLGHFHMETEETLQILQEAIHRLLTENFISDY